MHHTEPYHGRSLLLNSYGCHQNVGNLLCRGLKEFVELNCFANRNLSTFTLNGWKRWWTEREQHRRWWTTKAGRVLRAEEEQISKESRSERKKESLRIEETVNLTTKLKSLLFVIMHSHKRGSPHQKDVVLIRKTMIKYGSYSMMAETSMRYPSRKRTQ